MATTTIKQPYKFTNVSNGQITGSFYDFVKSSNCPQGVSVWDGQYATDSPVYQTVAIALINKPTPTGNYSVVFLYGNGVIYVSGQLNPSATAFNWYKATVTNA